MRSQQSHRLEVMIGTLLRIGVMLSASVVAVGAAVHLAGFGGTRPHYASFHGEPSNLTTIPGVLEGVAKFDGRSVVQLGLLLLIATPVARVIFSLAAFLHEKDWLYSLFTLVVLSVLGYSLFAR